MKLTSRCVAVVAFALCASASADTVSITWSNPVIQPGPGDGITWAGTSIAGSGSAAAGRFHGSVTAFTGSLTASDFVDGQSSLYAYCYDLLQTLHSGTYNVSYGAAARTLDFLGAVNYVLSGNSNTWLDSYAWLHPGDRNTAAAIQLGIWESLYDTSGWSLTSGDITFGSVETATANAYANFKAAVENASVNDLPSSLAMVFYRDGREGNQDVITGRRPSRQLPEPGSLLLIGAGAALARWSLRSRRQ